MCTSLATRVRRASSQSVCRTRSVAVSQPMDRSCMGWSVWATSGYVMASMTAGSFRREMVVHVCNHGTGAWQPLSFFVRAWCVHMAMYMFLKIFPYSDADQTTGTCRHVSLQPQVRLGPAMACSIAMALGRQVCVVSYEYMRDAPVCIRWEITAFDRHLKFRE